MYKIGKCLHDRYNSFFHTAVIQGGIISLFEGTLINILVQLMSHKLGHFKIYLKLGNDMGK
jgi:hypothetical protein